MDDVHQSASAEPANEAVAFHPAAMNRIVERLERDLDAMCVETLRQLQLRVPSLIRLLPPEVLVASVRGTHERAIALLRGAPETDMQRAGAIELGRRAAQAGLSPDDVLAGYRIGADIANDRARAVLLEDDAGTGAVLALWRWSTRFFDDLAERTVDGVRREHARRQHRSVRDQQALVEALLSGTTDPALETAAGWHVPENVRVVVARGGDLELGPGQGVVGRSEGRLVAVTTTGADWLSAPGTPLAVGPAVPRAQAARSWRSARLAAELVGTDGPVVATADSMLVDLALLGDPYARLALPGSRLAPVDALPDRQRAVIESTLRAWLASPGRPTVIAAALGLHPQTIQYRLRRLRDVVGDAIDDPAERFAFELALRLRDTETRLGRPSA